MAALKVSSRFHDSAAARRNGLRNLVYDGGMAGNGSRRSVTMTDVATMAGVSATTVSHVVNRTRPVAPSTEQAVMAAVAQLGYVPDSVVRSQRSAGTRTIGLAMSAISNPYFADVVRGIDETLSQAGYQPLLAETHDDVTRELRAVSELLSRGVEAIILAASRDPSGALQHARQQGVPVVLIDRFFEAAEVDQIAVLSKEPTAQLVDHLVEVGHRRIAMISGQPGLSTTDERVAGFRLGMQRNKRRVLKEYVISGNSTDDGARSALRALLELPTPPSVVVVGNNQMTIAVLREARDRAVRVPDDLAVVSFDDFEWADLFHPRLTAIAQPTHAMGAQAADMVLKRLADPAILPRRVSLTPTFVHGESCGCPPTTRSNSPKARLR